MIAAKTWREIRWMTLVYTLILELLLVPAVLLWPTLRTEAAAIGRIIPIQSFKRMFADISADSDLAYNAYMAVQLFFKGTNIVGISAAVLFTTGIIARERESHTLEFLLSRPLSRPKILWNKFWPCAVAIVVPIYLTTWTAIPLSWAIDEQLPFAELTTGATHAAAFCLLFLALTTLCSVSSRTQVHAAFVVGSITIVQVAVYFIQKIRIGSLFMLSDYGTYGPVLAGNLPFSKLFFESTVWLLAATALVYLIADRAFRRADL